MQAEFDGMWGLGPLSTELERCSAFAQSVRGPRGKKNHRRAVLRSASFGNSQISGKTPENGDNLSHNLNVFSMAELQRTRDMFGVGVND